LFSFVVIYYNISGQSGLSIRKPKFSPLFRYSKQAGTGQKLCLYYSQRIKPGFLLYLFLHYL